MSEPEVMPPFAAARLAAALGLRGPPVTTRTWTGATSTVLVWDDRLTVKVPHADPAAVSACLTHARMSPAARALGVRTPRVALVTQPGDPLPVPVVVSAYLPGSPAAADVPAVWSAVGAQLALLHAARPTAVPAGLRRFTQTPEVDPGVLATTLADEGVLGGGTLDRLLAVRDRLAPTVLGRETWVLCHGDVHADNVVVGPDGRYAGLLDLAGAGWLDPAWDFVGMPLAAVGPAVAGYRAAGGRTEGLLPRVAWCRLQTVLHRAGGDPDARAWVTRALGQVDALLDAP